MVLFAAVACGRAERKTTVTSDDSKASPKIVVMEPGQHVCRVVIQSRDDRLFRITGIECELPGIQGKASSTDAALMQMVRVESEGVPRTEGGRAVITVFTDHPAQRKVDLPFIVLD